MSKKKKPSSVRGLILGLCREELELLRAKQHGEGLELKDWEKIDLIRKASAPVKAPGRPADPEKKSAEAPVDAKALEAELMKARAPDLFPRRGPPNGKREGVTTPPEQAETTPVAKP